MSQLVPGYLEALPEDPCDPGNPLKYRLDADGTWVVYSVGPNGHDDGGNAGGCMAEAYSPGASLGGHPAGRAAGMYTFAVPDEGTAWLGTRSPNAWRYAHRAYTDRGYAGRRLTPPPDGWRGAREVQSVQVFAFPSEPP